MDKHSSQKDINNSKTRSLPCKPHEKIKTKIIQMLNLFTGTNGPLQIWSPCTNGAQKFGPPGQLDPNQFDTRISGSLQPFPLDIQNILDQLSRKTNLVRDHLSMGSESTGDQSIGDQSIGGPINWGTN